ncbi:tetratricopeptide repeat protein [Mucilaginibacter puniceus]
MKRILNLIILSLLTLSAYSQQVNDALLLDYYQNQRYLEASNYLKSIYPEPINDIKALSRLAYTSQMAGKLPDAEGYYQRMYTLDSTNKAVLYNLAAVNYRRSNYNKAETYYKKILSTDSTDYQIYKYLANIRLRKIDSVGYLKHLEKANILNPIDFDIASDLTEIYIKFKKYKEAEKVLNIALAADPENIVLLQNNLELAFSQKKWQQVIKTGEQLFTLGDYTMRIFLGIAYYYANNYICGLETLMPITAGDHTETSYYFIASCYKKLNGQKKAIPYFQKAIKKSLAGSTDTYYNELADSYQQLSQFKTAEATYKKGLLYGQLPMTYYSMAILYDTKIKDKKNALLYYKKYLATNPTDEDKGYVDYSKNRIAALSAH